MDRERDKRGRFRKLTRAEKAAERRGLEMAMLAGVMTFEELGPDPLKWREEGAVGLFVKHWLTLSSVLEENPG